MILVRHARNSRAILCVGALVILSTVLFTGPQMLRAGERVLADRIIALVNDQIVTEQQLEQALSSDRQYLSLLEQASGTERTDLLRKRKREVLDLLIDRLLVVSEGKRLGIVPNDEVIEKRVKSTMDRFGIETEEEFARVLEREGLTPYLLKALYADEYVEQSVIDARIRSRIDISEAEILAYAEENESLLATPEKASFAQLLFRVSDFNKEEDVSSARKAAQNAVDRLASGEPFDKVCESAEGAMRSCDGMGLLGKDEMFKAISDVVFALEIGQVSGIVESPMGFHIVRLLDKQGGDAEMTPELKMKIKETLFIGEFKKQYEAFLEGLRAKCYLKIMNNAS
ncbi:MAG: SurA N-terminal domain-containing protein [Candidatus Coatesbacteria bacterium]|nr:SurA N-terminal domain-containing protein [Candidatus Coatesbacteria bacterium]